MLHPSELAHWLQMRLNRPAGALDEVAFWSLFDHGAEPLSAAPSTLAAGVGPASLLVVVTTYRRPDACARLLDALAAALAAESAPHVLVFNDHSDADYAAVRLAACALFPGKLTWLDARARLGKPGFWQIYQTAFLAARALRPAHALFLQDDVELAPSLRARIDALWRATAHDDKRRVLYLFSSDEDEQTGRWVHFRRREVGPGLRLTQWFDLQAFFVDEAFFELLDYRMVPIHPNRWRRRPRISSGVGRQLTVRLRGRGHVYQAYPPLVGHGALTSEMNAEARAARTLDNRPLLAREPEE